MLSVINYSNSHFNFVKKNKRLNNTIQHHIHELNQSHDEELHEESKEEYKNDQCGGILFDKTGKYVLLIKQRLSNKWGLPKGHMNKREIINNDKMECVKREINEETGINLNKIKYYYIDSLCINNREFFIFQINKYKESINLNPFDLNEICDFEWISIWDLHNFCKNNNCNRTLREMERLHMKHKLFKTHKVM
jgi:8-oxo-dGTP pyrophosphatase MutT (NUDIX family)